MAGHSASGEKPQAEASSASRSTPMDAPQTNEESSRRTPIDPLQPMDFEEICSYLKATPSTIRSDLAEGMTEVGFKLGKEWRFLPLDVIDWLKRRHQRQAARKQKTTNPHRSTPRSGHSQIDQFLEKHWPGRR